MLRALGIDAHLALIRSSGPFMPELPSLDQFDHMIVYVPSRNAFIDATDKWGDLTLGVPWGLEGKTALVLDPKSPRLVTIPPPRNDSGQIQIQRTARLDNQTDLIIHESDRFTGLYAAEMRSLLLASEPLDRVQTLEHVLKDCGLSCRVRQFHADGIDAPDQPLVLEIDYVAQRSFRILNGQIVGAVPCPIERYFFAPPATDRRETPWKIRYGLSIQTLSILELTPGDRFVGAPLGASADPPHTHGHATHAISGQSLSSKLLISTDAVDGSPETYDKLVRTRQDLLGGLEAAVAITPSNK